MLMTCYTLELNIWPSIMYALLLYSTLINFFQLMEPRPRIEYSSFVGSGCLKMDNYSGMLQKRHFCDRKMTEKSVLISNEVS